MAVLFRVVCDGGGSCDGGGRKKEGRGGGGGSRGQGGTISQREPRRGISGNTDHDLYVSPCRNYKPKRKRERKKKKRGHGRFNPVSCPQFSRRRSVTAIFLTATNTADDPSWTCRTGSPSALGPRSMYLRAYIQKENQNTRKHTDIRTYNARHLHAVPGDVPAGR